MCDAKFGIFDGHCKYVMQHCEYVKQNCEYVMHNCRYLIQMAVLQPYIYNIYICGRETHRLCCSPIYLCGGHTGCVAALCICVRDLTICPDIRCLSPPPPIYLCERSDTQAGGQAGGRAGAGRAVVPTPPPLVSTHTPKIAIQRCVG